MSVYFIQDVETQNIKIGYSATVPSRLKALRRGHGDLELLSVIENGTRLTERNLHELFAADRVGGEWFRPSDALLRFIERSKTEEAITSVEGLLEFLRTSVACINIAGFTAFIEQWLIVDTSNADGSQFQRFENAGGWKAAEIVLTLGGHAERQLEPGAYSVNRNGTIAALNTKWLGVSDDDTHPTPTEAAA